MKIVAALFVMVSACGMQSSNSPTPVSPAARPVSTSEPHAEVDAPVVASWRVVRVPAAVSGASQDGDRLVIVARIETHGSIGMPLSVTVEAPTGITTLRGTTTYTIPTIAPGVVHETEFEFQVPAVPGADLVLVVHGESAGAGVHARIPYAFGRSDTLGPRPTPSGPTLTIGRRNSGAPSSGQN